jgi:hypothetical protein
MKKWMWKCVVTRHILNLFIQRCFYQWIIYLTKGLQGFITATKRTWEQFFLKLWAFLRLKIWYFLGIFWDNFIVDYIILQIFHQTY